MDNQEIDTGRYCYYSREVDGGYKPFSGNFRTKEAAQAWHEENGEFFKRRRIVLKLHRRGKPIKEKDEV